MNETAVFIFSMACYLVAFVTYSVSASMEKQKLYLFSRRVSWVGVLAALAALALRWYSAGHPPLTNMYESLVTLSTFIGLVGLMFTARQPIPLLEAGTCVGAILMIGVASVFSSSVKPLIPALQSYWLHLHVSLAFIGEACFAVAFVLSYLLCFRKAMSNSADNNQFADAREKLACYSVVVGLPAVFIAGMVFLANHLRLHPMYQERWHGLVWGVVLPSAMAVAVLCLFTYLFRGAIGKNTDRWLPDNDTLDKLVYRAIALGYPLFTVGGLIFGMVWANKAWGRYWGWDPKETWALITFLVYSIYLHVRLGRGWNGTWTACISVVGFIVTMFTLFGVNLLISRLHSYAGA
jgi:cytochrome c-type biogenesis protein CcsB